MLSSSQNKHRNRDQRRFRLQQFFTNELSPYSMFCLMKARALFSYHQFCCSRLHIPRELNISCLWAFSLHRVVMTTGKHSQAFMTLMLYMILSKQVKSVLSTNYDSAYKLKNDFIFVLSSKSHVRLYCIILLDRGHLSTSTV